MKQPLLGILIIIMACGNILSYCTDRKSDPPLTSEEHAYVDRLRRDDSLLIVDLYARLDSMRLASDHDGQDCMSLKIRNDSLANALFVAKYRVERVKYYLNITLRNPSQTKFLKGWIKRAVE